MLLGKVIIFLFVICCSGSDSRSNSSDSSGGRKEGDRGSDSSGRSEPVVRVVSSDNALLSIKTLTTKEVDDFLVNNDFGDFDEMDKKFRSLENKVAETISSGSSAVSFSVPLVKLKMRISANKLVKIYPPRKKVCIDNHIFYVSSIIESPRREFAILYVVHQNKMISRMMYRSKSSGNWMVAPCVTNIPGSNGTGQYTNGTEVHDTQEAKPHLFLLIAMNQLDAEPKIHVSDKRDITNFFIVSFKSLEGVIAYFKEEVSSLGLSPGVSSTLKAIVECQPGSCFAYDRSDRQKNIPLRVKEILSTIDKINSSFEDSALRGFMPDFKDSIDSYEFKHTLLGHTNVNVYMGILDGRSIEWHMANDSLGRVWVDRIQLENSKVSSFGVPKIFIDSGALTNKPLEHEIQARRLVYVDGFIKKSQGISLERRPFYILYPKSNCGNYVDITGFLDQILPIKKYRAVRGLINRAPTEY